MTIVSLLTIIAFIVALYIVYIWLSMKFGRDPNNIVFISILLAILVLLFIILTYTVFTIQKNAAPAVLTSSDLADANVPNVYETNLLEIQPGNVFVFDDTGFQFVTDCAKGNISTILIQGTFFLVGNTPTQKSVVLNTVKGLPVNLALPMPSILHILAWR